MHSLARMRQASVGFTSTRWWIAQASTTSASYAHCRTGFSNTNCRRCPVFLKWQLSVAWSSNTKSEWTPKSFARSAYRSRIFKWRFNGRTRKSVPQWWKWQKPNTWFAPLAIFKAKMIFAVFHSASANPVHRFGWMMSQISVSGRKCAVESPNLTAKGKPSVRSW